MLRKVGTLSNIFKVVAFDNNIVDMRLLYMCNQKSKY